MSSSSSISVRDLLTLIALTALICTAMRLGGLVASATVFLVLLLVMLRSIVAFVSAGDERKAAIGFMVPVAIYGLAIAWIGRSEFGSDLPVLISSQLLWMTCRGVGPDRVVEVMSLGHGLVALYLGVIGEMFARTVKS